MNKRLVVFFVLVLLISIGFIREFTFTNVNTIIYNKVYNQSYHVHPVFNFTNNLSYMTIYVSKWFLTAFFVGLFLLMQYKLSELLFADIFKKWFIYFYLALIIVSIITFFTGWVFGDLKQGYTFSRLFLGFLQSPLPTVFLTPICYFYKKNIY